VQLSDDEEPENNLSDDEISRPNAKETATPNEPSSAILKQKSSRFLRGVSEFFSGPANEAKASPPSRSLSPLNGKETKKERKKAKRHEKVRIEWRVTYARTPQR
jgi:hypothetical protein